MIEIDKIDGYRYENSALNDSHRYLLPALLHQLDRLAFQDPDIKQKKQLFELGCGNGSIAAKLKEKGWEATGVDPSTEGIRFANQTFPTLQLRLGSAYDDLEDQYGQFPVVISLEVVEHLYFPRRWASTIYNLTEPGGTAIISTPYHGYWKNLALALTGKLDAHFTALWDHGHIKFWSIKTLSVLLEEAGFESIGFERIGRLPPFAKCMIAVARKPL